VKGVYSTDHRRGDAYLKERLVICNDEYTDGITLDSVRA